jgi:hypothetical protein
MESIMSQNNLFLPTQGPSGKQQYLQEDASGNLFVTNVNEGELSALNVASATVIKAGSGHVGKLIIQSVGTANGSVNDCLTTAQVNTSNQLIALTTAGLSAMQVIPLTFPFKTGLVVTPGTGQVIAVSYT